jgi:hypothetical protein
MNLPFFADRLPIIFRAADRELRTTQIAGAGLPPGLHPADAVGRSIRDLFRTTPDTRQGRGVRVARV